MVSTYYLHASSDFEYVLTLCSVVGGTAGNVVATRLSENPAFSVLVIEAGGEYVIL